MTLPELHDMSAYTVGGVSLLAVFSFLGIWKLKDFLNPVFWIKRILFWAVLVCVGAGLMFGYVVHEYPEVKGSLIEGLKGRAEELVEKLDEKAGVAGETAEESGENR